MSFFDMFNLFETNINFTIKSNNKYRLQFSLILIILFIAFIIIKIFDDLGDNFPTSIASLNNYVKIHNSDCVEFTTTDILTKLDEIPDTCNISVQFQLAGNHKIIDLIKENYSEDKTLMRHYLPPNASLYSNLRQPSEDDYFDLESKIYYKCKDKNDKAFEKTKYNNTDAPTIFINSKSKYDSILKLTNEDPFITSKKQILKLNNHLKDEITDLNQYMINSWDFEYEPVKIIDDRDYFSISRLKNRDLDKDYSNDYKIHSTQKNLVKYMVSDITSDNGLLIGFVNYRISKTGKLIIRNYPKFSETFPILLLVILLVAYTFKMLFYIYDYNGIYCEYVNTFFNLSNDDAKKQDDKANKSTFISQKTNITESRNDNFNDKSLETFTNTNTQILIEKQQSFNDKKFKSKEENNTSIFQYKSPKLAIKEAKKTIVIGTSFIDSYSSIENKSNEEKDEIKQDENKIDLKLSNECFNPYSFGFCDLMNFYCPFSKRSKLKRNLFKNCKDQLSFYLNPLYYFKLSAVNEEKIVDSLTENKIFSACLSYQQGKFEISRNMSVLRKLNSKENKQVKSLDDKLFLIDA